MKIKMSVFKGLVERIALRRIAEEEEKKGKPEVAAADSEPSKKAKKDGEKDSPPKPRPPPQDKTVDPAEEEPLPEPSPEEAPAPKKAKAGGQGKVSSELVGKTIQGMSAEPKSKILPGAQEIVLSLDQSSDPLRILVTRSGRIVYHWKGQTHNVL